jgi:hypothetical protein
MGLSGPIKERALASLQARRPLCADCRCAELYAVELRADCWNKDAVGYGHPHDVMESACISYVPKGGDDLTLHCFDLHVPLLAA